MRVGLLLVALLVCAPAILVCQDHPRDSPSKARVFITDSKSWEVSSGGGGTAGGFGNAGSGGARPQTAEIIKTFGERCPDVIVNNKQEKADYIVLLDHEGRKAVFFT